MTNSTTPSIETLLASKCGTQFPDTGERIPMTINSRHRIIGWTPESGEPGRATQVTLTSDGRRYDRHLPWHVGPEAESVFVEIWNEDGRVFHGWIDSVSRRLVQVG